MNKATENYWDILNEAEFSPHELFKNLLLTNSEENKEKNISYFLDNIEKIKALNLNHHHKKFLYYALTTKIKSEITSPYYPAMKTTTIEDIQLSQLTRETIFEFNRLPFYLAFKRSTDILIETLNYFNDEINDYVKSEYIKAKINSQDIEKIVKVIHEKEGNDLSKHNNQWDFYPILLENFSHYVQTHQGLEKLEALLNTSLFLPYQKKEFSIAIEHYYLSHQLPDKNSDSDIYQTKTKIKI